MGGGWGVELHFELVDLGRKVEYSDGEVENANAGDDQIHNVEKRLPSNFQVEENVCKEKVEVKTTACIACRKL